MFADLYESFPERRTFRVLEAGLTFEHSVGSWGQVSHSSIQPDAHVLDCET